MKKKTDFLGALLLKWLKENKIEIQKEEVGKIFKKEDTCIILNATNSLTNQLEDDLYSMMKEASKDGILQSKEFEKWCSSHYSKLLNWFDKVLDEQRDKLVTEGKITIEEKGKFFKSKTYTVDSSLMDEAIEINGLQKFLKEFTLINKREAIEVTLFEDYLIYAQIFGIAKQVAEQFKNLYPDIIENQNYNYTYNDILFINSFAYSSISHANTAQSRAESYSSGGGGFSSGGGRRRIIWWWRWLPEADKKLQFSRRTFLLQNHLFF